MFFTSLISAQDIFVQLTDSQMDSTLSGNIEVSISSSSDIGGFQFQTTGGVLEDASGGFADEYGFLTSSSENGMVISFTMTGNPIPAGDGILINLEYSAYTNSELCLTNPIFSNPDAENLVVDTGVCLPTGVVPTTPTVTILTPQEGETLSQDFINVSVNNSDPGAGYHYHAYINGNLEGMYYEENFVITDLPWGMHELEVILADTAHDECTDSNCSDAIMFTLSEPVPEFATLSFGAINPNEQTVEIILSNSGEVGGVQFNITGVNVTDMTGGSAEEYGFTNQTMNNVVLSFTLTGNWIPAGEQLFTTLSYDEVLDEQLCMTNAIVSNEWGDEIPVTLNDCVDIPEPMNEYYIVDLEQTGVSQLLELSSVISSLEPGDEIGVFDLNGVIETTNDCGQIQIGEVLVGAGIWSASGISVVATGSVNTCDMGGYATAGYILGNPISIRVYRPSTGMEYETNFTVSAGSASFSELFAIVDTIELIGGENQLPVAVLAENEFELIRGENFTLDGSPSYDNDGTILSYEWFLNGIDLIGNGAILNYSFDAIGAFTISLVVTDDAGGTGATSAGILVENQFPSQFSLLTPVDGQTFIVDNTNIETGMVDYSWESSSDADNDELLYRLEIWDTEMNMLLDTITTETDYSVGFGWGAFGIQGGQLATFNWKVSVSDGYDEVGTTARSFTLDATSLGIQDMVMDEFTLLQNYPNPFNPVTEIGFILSDAGWVELTIFDITGRKINSLISRQMNVGQHRIHWNAIDDSGLEVPAGIYIYRLITSKGVLQNNMMLIK